jgi:hypothetical protein
MDFGLWTLSRDGTRVIDKSFIWDDREFLVGAEVRSEFDTSWFRAAYKYSILNTDRGEAGITAGFSAYEFDLALEGEARLVEDGVPIDPPVLVGGRTEESILAPVPTIGFFINYAMRPRLLLKVKADFFDLSVSGFEGHLVDTAIGIDWYFSRHVGIGLLSNVTNINIKDTGEDPFNVEYRQSGLVGYFTFVFGKTAS